MYGRFAVAYLVGGRFILAGFGRFIFTGFICAGGHDFHVSRGGEGRALPLIGHAARGHFYMIGLFELIVKKIRVLRALNAPQRRGHASLP
jgi:hypothetical protein